MSNLFHSGILSGLLPACNVRIFERLQFSYWKTEQKTRRIKSLMEEEIPLRTK